MGNPLKNAKGLIQMAYYNREAKKLNKIADDLKFARETKNYNPPSSGGNLTDFDKQVLNARFNASRYKDKMKKKQNR